MGCAALSPQQQSEQVQGGTWVQIPTNGSSTTGNQAARNEASERNSRIRTVNFGPAVRAEAPVLAGSAALAATVREEGEDWIGTRYRYGGTTRRGIDCSSFVQQLMRGALDIELPRTTATQVHEGDHIRRDELLPADLVFFRRRGVRHVGVYLGDGEFIHASSSRGVIVSNLTQGYYNRHYWTARRVIDNPRDFLAGEDLIRRGESSGTIRPGTTRNPIRGRSGSSNPRASW